MSSGQTPKCMPARVFERALRADFAAYSRAACARTTGERTPTEAHARTIRESLMPVALLTGTDSSSCDRAPKPNPFDFERTLNRILLETVAVLAAKLSRANGIYGRVFWGGTGVNRSPPSEAIRDESAAVSRHAPSSGPMWAAAGYFAFAPCKMISVSVSITRLAGRNRPVTYWHASVLTPG